MVAVLHGVCSNHGVLAVVSVRALSNRRACGLRTWIHLRMGGIQIRETSSMGKITESAKIASGGFCMALADSVPGVSGSTVAFVMGFYDTFISSLHDLAGSNAIKIKTSLSFLIKLFLGWIIGMTGAVLFLSLSCFLHGDFVVLPVILVLLEFSQLFIMRRINRK